MSAFLVRSLVKSWLIPSNILKTTPKIPQFRLSSTKSHIKAAVLECHYKHHENHSTDDDKEDKDKGKDSKEEPKKAPPKLVIKEIPRVKKLHKDEVRIQVHYCSLNAVDCNLFSDECTKLPFVPGYEISGDVTEVGKNVGLEHISIGEEVAALSLDNYGGFAEEIVVNKNDIWRLPVGVDTKSAASYVYGHSMAVYAFSKIAPLKENETVAISIGAAGLGIAGIDVASHVFHSKVIAVVDTEDRGSFVRDKGAFGVVTFKEGKLHKKILDLTDGKGVNVAYDAVGGSYMKDMGSSVMANGTIFYLSLLDLHSIPSPPLNTTMTILSLRELRRQNLTYYRQLVEETIDMAHQGITNPQSSAEFKLEHINEAIEFVEQKKCTGKVVIKILD